MKLRDLLRRLQEECPELDAEVRVTDENCCGCGTKSAENITLFNHPEDGPQVILS